MTAATSVDSAGLLLAAVATGSSVIPVKLPSPSAGTAEQPAPNGSSDTGLALLSRRRRSSTAGRAGGAAVGRVVRAAGAQREGERGDGGEE